jgi:GNAT superfamily N-acetyltransferase
MTLSVRVFDPADVVAVVSLHHRALEPTGAHAGGGPWDDDLNRIEAVYLRRGGTFLVGTVEGEIVAMGALKRTDATTCEVKRMRVDPRDQGQGYGQAILSALEQRARELRIERLFLETAVVQVAAQRLYERNGYSRIGDGDFQGTPVIYYEKRLAPARLA